MKKSTCLEAYKDGFKLLQPLRYVDGDDHTYIKRHTKRVILEIIETVGKVTISFSGGTDSLFTAYCVKELVEEKKLTRDVYELVYFKLDLSNMKHIFMEVQPPSKSEQYVLDYIESYADRVFTLAPTINELLDFWNKEIKGLTHASAYGKYNVVYSYFRNKLDNYCVVSDGLVDYLNLNFGLNSYFQYSLQEENNQIFIYSWDIDVNCALLKTNFTVLDLKSPFHLSQKLWLKNQQYIQCIPETIYGLPKREEYPWMYFDMFKPPEGFLKQIPFLFHHDKSNGFSKISPMYLPNDKCVTSVEQTQEFFNRHS